MKKELVGIKGQFYLKRANEVLWVELEYRRPEFKSPLRPEFHSATLGSFSVTYFIGRL